MIVYSVKLLPWNMNIQESLRNVYFDLNYTFYANAFSLPYANDYS